MRNLENIGHILLGTVRSLMLIFSITFNNTRILTKMVIIARITSIIITIMNVKPKNLKLDPITNNTKKRHNFLEIYLLKCYQN